MFQHLRILTSPLALFNAFVQLIQLNLRTSRDVVFIASPVDVQTPLGKRYFPDKLEGVIKVVEDHELSVLYAFHLFSIKRKFERSSDFKRLEILIPLIIISHPITIIKNYKMIKEVYVIRQFNSLKQKIRASLWVSLFLIIKPKIIFGIGMDQVILTVCQRMRIETVEVMHGLFDSLNPPFSFRIEAETVKPGLFLSWHEDFTDIIQKLGISAVTIGYPNTLFQSFELPLADSKGNKILVSLAWGDQSSIDPNGIMTSLLYKHLKEIPSNSLRFRLHPVSCNSRKQISQNSRWLKKEFPGCSLVLPYNESLFKSLSTCSFHVSHESSTFFEASLLGKKTVLLQSRQNFHMPVPDEIFEFNLLNFAANLPHTKPKEIHEINSSSRFMAPFKRIELEKILIAANLIH